MRIGIDCRKAADFGIGTYIRGLLDSLESLEGDEEYVLFAPRRVRDLLPDSKRFHLVEHDAPHYSIGELFSLGRVINAARVDLFHAPHYVVPFTRTKVVTTIHDLIHLHQKLRNPAARVYARMMIGRAIRKSARILTVSQAVRQDLIAFDPAAAAKIVVTPNGVDKAFFDRRGNAPERRYFLFVGNDKPHKNLAALIEAFGMVRAQMADARLVIAGASPRRFRGEHGVAVAGFVSDDELVTMYRGAIALVLPSLEEGFGLPVAEAMAAGTPVIVSDIAALREVAGDAALLVDPHSPRAIADAMLRVARDPELSDAMAARGEDRARNFDWIACARRTLESYRDVLGSR